MKPAMKDARGIEVRVVELTWRETFGDFLETGTPAMTKRFILMGLKPEGRGRVVFGIRLEPDEEPVPLERVRARLRSSWRPPDANLEEWGHSQVEIEWFQTDGDPFATCASHVASLDWGRHAVDVTP